jgi:[ribosomal protein S5]-alanine N-acetyltransferase
MSTPLLRTRRLVLREPTQADARAVLVFRGDPHVQRFNSEPLRGETEAVALIDFLLAESASDARRHWVIVAADQVVGLIGLHAWDHGHWRAELGYELAASHWGRGLADEAARAVIEHGFTVMDLHRIEAHTIADNHASVHLLERLGFRLEGTRRDYTFEDDLAFHDSAIYSLLSTDARPR